VPAYRRHRAGAALSHRYRRARLRRRHRPHIHRAAECLDVTPSAIIPGRRAASSPESITTGRSFVVRPERFHQNTPFRGYGFRAHRYAMPRNDEQDRCSSKPIGCPACPTGDSPAQLVQIVRLTCPHRPIHARLPPKRPAPKNSFCKPPQTDQPIQPYCEKYFAFVFSEIDVSLCRPASHEGRYAIVTDVEAGCGGRVDGAAWLSRRRTASMRTVKSRGPDTPTLVSNRWRCSRIALMTVAKSPAHRGEREAAVKTIARGMPVASAEPVVTAACFFVAGGPWVRPASGIPRALCLRGHLHQQDSDAKRGARRQHHVPRGNGVAPFPATSESLMISGANGGFMVRSEGLEPPRFYSLPPQGSASTNSATSAKADRHEGWPEQRRRCNKSILEGQGPPAPQIRGLPQVF
jgi:hypothetical protein